MLELGNVSISAIALSTVASMAIGAGFYSTFSEKWCKAVGFDEKQLEEVQKGPPKGTFLIAALCYFVMAYILSGVIFHAGGFSVYNGMLSSFLIWLGFVVTGLIIGYRFQMKPWSLVGLDASCGLLILLAQGAILGAIGTSLP